jgi:hypothetical protein
MTCGFLFLTHLPSQRSLAWLCSQGSPSYCTVSPCCTALDSAVALPRTGALGLRSCHNEEAFSLPTRSLLADAGLGDSAMVKWKLIDQIEMLTVT